MKKTLFAAASLLASTTAFAGTDSITAVTCQEADGTLTAQLDLETDLERTTIIGLRLQMGGEVLESGEISQQGFLPAGAGGYLVTFGGESESVTFNLAEGYDANPERPDTLHYVVGDTHQAFSGCVIAADIESIESLARPQFPY